MTVHHWDLDSEYLEGAVALVNGTKAIVHGSQDIGCDLCPYMDGGCMLLGGPGDCSASISRHAFWADVDRWALARLKGAA